MKRIGRYSLDMVIPYVDVRASMRMDEYYAGKAEVWYNPRTMKYNITFYYGSFYDYYRAVRGNRGW